MTVVVVITVVTVAVIVLTVRLSLLLLDNVFVVVGAAPICKVGLQRRCLVRLACVTVTVSDSCTVTQ